jgi:hypothetical protein
MMPPVILWHFSSRRGMLSSKRAVLQSPARFHKESPMSEETPIPRQRRVSFGAIGFSLVLIACVGTVFYSPSALMWFYSPRALIWCGLILSVIAIATNDGRHSRVLGLIALGIILLVEVWRMTSEFTQSIGS